MEIPKKLDDKKFQEKFTGTIQEIVGNLLGFRINVSQISSK